MSICRYFKTSGQQFVLPCNSEGADHRLRGGFWWLRFSRLTATVSMMILGIATIVLSGCAGMGSKGALKLSGTESASHATLQVTTTSLPVGATGTSYSTGLVASGGTPPYSWSKTSGQLPAGLVLNAAGVISGKPTTAGSFSFDIKVVDSSAEVVAADFSLNVSAGPTPAVSSISPAAGATGGGTFVTVEGSNFSAGTAVVFGTMPAQSVRVVSSSQLQAVTPQQQTAGKVSVVVENSDGQVTNVPAGFTYTAPAPSTPAQAPTVNADVVVDAGQKVSETGGDDLAAAKNIFASASSPESNGGLSDWNLISSELAMTRMRIINGLGDCALSNSTLTGCTRLDGNLAQVRMQNLTPHVIVGQWKPTAIAGDARQWGSSQWAQYDALAYAIVNHVVNQFQASPSDTQKGFSAALFEVENEIDTTQGPQDLWLTTSPNVPQGDPSRFKQYDTVYRHWAAQVDKVAKQNPSKNIQIAAQAEGYQWVGVSKAWNNNMIATYTSQGVRFDAITLHAYGPSVYTIANFAQSIRTALNAANLKSTTILVTEWGAGSSDDSKLGQINATNQGAAWAVQFLAQCLQGTVTGGSFLEVRDNQGTDVAGMNSNMNSASWLHVQNNNQYPKPIMNAFNMISNMTGARSSVTVNPAKPNLAALASADSDSASVVVANFNTVFGQQNNQDLTTNETVTVAFKNLPLNGTVTIDRYLIDAKTSNLAMWAAAGTLPNSVQSSQLQKIESFPATSDQGVVSLPVRTLGQSAVSLWVVHR
jgi:hypothetical protein